MYSTRLNNTSPYLILYIGIFLLGSNGLFAKGIPLDAVSITQLRSVVAVIAIAVYLYFCTANVQTIPIKTRIGIYGLGVLMGLHWVTFFHAMQVSTVAIGMISLYTFPVMVVFMEAAMRRQLPVWKDIVAAVLVLLGIVVMAANELTGDLGSTVTGIFWGVVSALFFSVRNVLQKYCFADVSSERLMLHQVIAIAVMLLPFVHYSELPQLPNVTWLQLIALGVFTTAGAHTLLVYSYKKLPAKTVAMISCLQPVIGAVLAWLVLAEQPTLYIIIGGAIVLAVAINESWRASR